MTLPIGSSISSSSSDCFSKRSRKDSHVPPSAVSSSSSFRKISQWNCLPKALQCEIHTFLNLNEMSQIETLNQNWRSCANHTWTLLAEKNYSFLWREATRKVNPTKWNCLLSSALSDIVVQMSKAPNKDYHSIAMRLWSKYQYLMDLFPSFDCYAKERLLPYAICTTPYPSLAEVKRKIYETALHPTATSDALLHVLIELEQPSFVFQPSDFVNALFSLVTRAIKNGVGCATFLVTQAQTIRWEPSEINRYEQWAITSSENGDHRTLDALLDTETYPLEHLQRLREKYPTLPPVLRRFALQKADWSKKDAALKTAIEAYGKRVTPEVWNSAALVKFELTEYERADVLHLRAIKIYEESGMAIPAKNLAFAALIKLKLGQYLYKQAIAEYGADVPTDVLANSTHIKLVLKHYEDADNLYKLAMDKYAKMREAAPFLVITNAAIIKSERGDYAKADELFTQAIAQHEKDGKPIPPIIFARAAAVKYVLPQHREVYNREAHALYTKAIVEYAKTGEPVPSFVMDAHIELLKSQTRPVQANPA